MALIDLVGCWENSVLFSENFEGLNLILGPSVGEITKAISSSASQLENPPHCSASLPEWTFPAAPESVYMVKYLRRLNDRGFAYIIANQRRTP